jgi:Spy/CpxP family protein refolding chaperone
MNSTTIRGGLLLCFAGTAMWAQQPFERGRGQGDGPPGPPPPRRGEGMRGGPGGKWWDNPEMAKKLVLTAEQQKKMDDVFQASKLKLIDLQATLQKEEVILDGLMRGPQLDDTKILPSVDRIAQSRAELEKADARFLLGIRHVLTPEQWTQLQAERPAGGPPRGGRNGGGPGGPGGGQRGPGGPGGPPRPPQEE